MPTTAGSILRFELSAALRAIDTSKLTADRAQSMPWHLMPLVVNSLLHISRLFQWLQLRFLTKGSAFFPEITPFVGVFSALFRAFSDSYSATLIPTSDI